MKSASVEFVPPSGKTTPTRDRRFNTTFEHSYRDGEEWKTSDSFGCDDLLTLGFVATEALRWIMEQKQPQQPNI